MLLLKQKIWHEHKPSRLITATSSIDYTKLLMDVLTREELDKSKATFVLDAADIISDYIAYLVNENEGLDKVNITMNQVHKTKN
ncbi:hypothetical protein ACXFAU_10770 [Paenibacillus glucanolyticus]|uniref:hypothetical protein n=1 Tax=Paenibacillus sp. LBL TaxID=2940563 RepID=UPI0024741EE4|nr:hypothetical protein [Paenibacillus sp. LBL]